MNDIEKKILELWNQGITTAKIGAEIGKTKGSVCGLLWRMRQRGLIIPTRQNIKPSDEFREKRAEKREQKARFKQNGQPDLLKRFDQPIPPESLNIGFWKLTAHSCRYVVNDGRPEQYIFCGAPKVRGAYCKTHAEICFEPPKIPEKRYQRATLRFR